MSADNGASLWSGAAFGSAAQASQREEVGESPAVEAAENAAGVEGANEAIGYTQPPADDSTTEGT